MCFGFGEVLGSGKSSAEDDRGSSGSWTFGRVEVFEVANETRLARSSADIDMAVSLKSGGLKR
eukprot:6999133-Alexandrium_andersonii.AAC.1